ncbi:UNVERIFIED_CONTAM: Retrovirus-related Pol polyprotein from transposon [Sesamum radiatum]|uniref:Retrovirus-related Pol polyprotein from transposon n=2 Tax=Sesamum TaxID=4181 RepID=A0AAW2M725_SESRA
MPFGLTNAPSTFQALMNKDFQPYLRKFILVFFDDILVYSRSWGDHLVQLRQTLEVLRRNQLLVKRNKCQFGQRQVEYLGHVITEVGVAADPLKIQTMINWPLPQTLKELRGFLGLTGYCRRFIKENGQLTWPLMELLKKYKFVWTENASKAFYI